MDFRELLDASQARVQEFIALRDAGLIHQTGTFFPAGIHYPPITMYPETNEVDFLKGWKDPDDGRYVFYVHVPFCRRQCTYCHYPNAIGRSEQDQERVIGLLGKEMDIWLQRLGLDKIRAHSVLVGGGSPSFLSPRLFRKLHEEMAQRVDLSACTQLTYDVHPEDLVGPQGWERLSIMRDYGSDRLTLGVQELRESVLRHMNRPSSPTLTREAMEACRRAGFTDLNIEFIFGYPGQTPETWFETLRGAVALDPEEIQFYRLKVQTYGQGQGAVENMYARRPDQFLENQTQVLMKEMAINYVNAMGYNENLIRVFTKSPKYTSDYATDQCCKLLDTVGVGPSAFSSFRDRFSIQEPELDRWAKQVEAGVLPVFQGKIRSRDDQLRWNLLLPLKNSEVYKDFYEERTGVRAERVFKRQLDVLKAHGLLVEDETELRLTKKGKFYGDEICTQLSHPDLLPHSAEGYADGPLKLVSRLEPGADPLPLGAMTLDGDGRPCSR